MEVLEELIKHWAKERFANERHAMEIHLKPIIRYRELKLYKVGNCYLLDRGLEILLFHRLEPALVILRTEGELLDKQNHAD